MIKENITISNKYGLHTRAAIRLVELAKKFHSTISLVNQNHSVDCKSIMALMMLGAKKGMTLELVVCGADENEAATAITGLIANRFNEAE